MYQMPDEIFFQINKKCFYELVHAIEALIKPIPNCAYYICLTLYKMLLVTR